MEQNEIKAAYYLAIQAPDTQETLNCLAEVAKRLDVNQLPWQARLYACAALHQAGELRGTLQDAGALFNLPIYCRVLGTPLCMRDRWVQYEATPQGWVRHAPEFITRWQSIGMRSDIAPVFEAFLVHLNPNSLRDEAVARWLAHLFL